jgi:small conductance mechanosensitive channel
LFDKVGGWARDLILLLPNLAVALLLLLAFWIAARVSRDLLLRVLRRLSASDQVNRLLAQALYVVVFGAGLFVALGVLQLEKLVVSLLAGAGILTLALGFAFQDIATNFMAGIYLNIQRPFRPGHLIETKDHFGTVQRVSLRWTEIRTVGGQMVLIPNKEVFENAIKNYSATGKRRVDLQVGVAYGSDLRHVREVALAAVEAVPTRLPDRPLELFFQEFGDSSINFEVRFWIDFIRQPDYLKARSEAVERIKSAFDAEGITIPFPIRTLDFAPVGGVTLSEVAERAGLGVPGPGTPGAP